MVKRNPSNRSEEDNRYRNSLFSAFCIHMADPDKRVAPSAVVRHSLFGVVNRRGPRKMFSRQLMATWGKGCELIYTGPELDQIWDQNVYSAIMEILEKRLWENRDFVDQRFEKKIFLRTHLGIKELNGNAYLQLDRSLERLAAGTMTYIDNKGKYTGSLIERVINPKGESFFMVRINCQLNEIYDGGFAVLDLKRRREKISGDLALWVDGFISSHSEVTWISVDKIRELSRSQIQNDSTIKAQVTEVLKEMAMPDMDKGGGRRIIEWGWEKNTLFVFHDGKSFQKWMDEHDKAPDTNTKYHTIKPRH
ncbi:MAG: hypothetical protein KKB70_07880 [Proteobacteria bacterium]|nr:hypothetical protein [Pseudomonadota bacterium]